MKKQILTLLIIASVLFIGCSNDSKIQDQTAKIDSTKIKLDIEKENSILKDQNKVIGDIVFGISEKEFEKGKENFLKSSKTKNDLVYTIGDYNFSGLDGFFESDTLYKVEVNGKYIHYEDYKSSFINQVEALKLILINKYGDPSGGSGAPQWHNTEKGYSYLTYEWKIGTKSIEMRTVNKGLYYTLNLEIFQPSVVKAIEDRIEKAKTTNADKAKDVL